MSCLFVLHTLFFFLNERGDMGQYKTIMPLPKENMHYQICSFLIP